jgi:hypothetical protein
MKFNEAKGNEKKIKRCSLCLGNGTVTQIDGLKRSCPACIGKSKIIIQADTINPDHIETKNERSLEKNNKKIIKKGRPKKSDKIYMKISDIF